jgi:hypothetical protein
MNDSEKSPEKSSKQQEVDEESKNEDSMDNFKQTSEHKRFKTSE